jgi:acetylornithine/N-succinyldiaminopimelate aminotransferase
MRPDFEQMRSREKKDFFSTYRRLNIHIDKGKGCYLYTTDGRKILDMFGGLAVNILGYNNKDIIKAVNEQSRRYMHLSNLFYQDAQIKLAEKLLAMSGYSKIFFTNSGTEAAETAIKIIRKHFRNTEKKTLISFTGGFHGRTMGALSIIGKLKYREGYEPFLRGTKLLSFNSIDELEKHIEKDAAAVFVECIQGEGGVVPASVPFIRKLVELRKKYGFLIIADEIQSGLGRTGKLFAFEHYGLKPDLVLLAKGLGGGLPLGAVLGNKKTASVFSYGQHGSTFGGNPVSCAAGLVLLRELEKGLMKKAASTGKYLKKNLLLLKERYKDKIIDVRGEGLMLGIELSFECKKVVEMMLEEGVLVNCTNNNVIRLLPPFIITRKESDLCLEKFEKVLVRVKI